VRDNCNGGGGPALVTGTLDDGNGDGIGGGGPAQATDARHDNNRNGDVHGEGNCGGAGSGDGGGDNSDNDDDDKEDGSNDDDGSNGGDGNNDDSSDGDNNGSNGGDSGGGCDTVMAAGIDTDNNQLKAAMDNGHGRPRGCPWFPCCNFLVGFLLLHIAMNVPWE